jgi:hypothetical protein
MAFSFKIWDQGNDGQTMAIRVEDTVELQQFASACDQPDSLGTWKDLQDYLQAANSAAGTPPAPYVRIVDVVWLSNVGYATPQYFPGKTLVVTYTGNQRSTGGFASQCYCIVDPQGFPALGQHHKTPIQVEYVTHPTRDAIVVR